MSIGYFDPNSLQMGEHEASVSFIDASNGEKTSIIIKTQKQARHVINAMRDQIEHGLAGSQGRIRKVSGMFTRTPDRVDQGVIVDEHNRNTPILAKDGIDVGKGFPLNGICVALGEMVDGALELFKIFIQATPTMPKRVPPRPDNGGSPSG